MSNKTKMLWVQAFTFGSTSADPAYARIELTDKLVERVLSVGAVAEEMGLSEVRFAASPESWGPETDELRLVDGEAVVLRNAFWFRECVRHESGNIETEAITLDALRHLWEMEVRHVFISGFEDVNEFADQIRDCGEMNLPTEGQSLFAYHHSKVSMDGPTVSVAVIPAKPFIGEDHPRYTEWQGAAESGDTLLGLADWLDHNPPDEDEDE